MKIVVFSDTHGNFITEMSCLAEAEPVDLVIHLGDETSDADILGSMTSVPILKVPGNCDHSAGIPREICRNISGYRIFMTHGDRYRVKAGLSPLIEKASEQQADIVLFGHTHCPEILEERGILLVNPGTLMKQSSLLSYAVVTLSTEGVTAQIVPVTDATQQPQPQL